MRGISVIIPVYNEEGTVGRCLASLGGQAEGAKEIVVVDDGSTDKTWKLVSDLRSTIHHLKLLMQDHKGPGAARNLGASKASGDILVFVDADMRFSPTFLEDLTKPIREGKSKGTFSKLEFVSNWDNRWARFWNYRKGIFEPRAIPANYPNRAPVFRAILKSEFDRVGGFDETRGYDDDWSLSERLGYHATAAKAVYYHDNPASFGEVFSQLRWAAKRAYRFGVIGGIWVVIRAFPLWSAPLFAGRLLTNPGRTIESRVDILLFGTAFSLIAQTGELIGVLEFLLTKKGAK